MPLPPDFQFTQSNLQDFLDCERRFELRHLMHVRWPARLVDSAQEQQVWMEQGSRFHFLLSQFFSGLEVGLLETTIHDETIAAWWQAFLAWYSTEQPSGELLPEYTLRTQVGGRSLAAKFDLLICTPRGQVVILDWKTSRQRPPDSVLRRRIQTSLYPLVVVRSGAEVSAGRRPITPDDVEMIYWFAGRPDQPMRIPYNYSRYETDLSLVTALVEEISRKEPGAFSPVHDPQSCRFCTYRSLCDQGVVPGRLEDIQVLEDELELTGIFDSLEKNLDQVGEAWL